MSVVCCKVYEDKIEIASDSILVRWWTQTKDKNHKRAKLFEVNDLVIGGVGIAEENGLMEIYCATHRPRATNETDMLQFLSEFAEWKKKRTDKFPIENNYLIAFDGKVFYINGFFVTEVLTFDAIGAGMDFALASLRRGDDVREAVETACELSVFCEKPVKMFVIPKTIGG
jgi:hypothetical protein